MNYINVVPAIVRFLETRLPSSVEVVGGEIPSTSQQAGVVSIKGAGGQPQSAEPFTRVRLLTRDVTDLKATNLAIKALNILANEFDAITEFNIKDLRVETALVDAIDDSGMRESWCYIAIYHLEA